DGERALGRPRDGARRRSGGRPRGARRRDRPSDRPLRRRSRPRGGVRPLPHPATAGHVHDDGRARTGRDRLAAIVYACPIERSVNEEKEMTVKGFFAQLPGRADPEKTAGMHNTYVFDIEDVGQWTVSVEDGTVSG